MKEDFLWIKKFYGEHIAKLCREIVPELFEEPSLVPRLLQVCFAPHTELYQDMLSLGKYNIRNYMYSRLDRKEELFSTPKSAKELLADAGYRLFVCSCPDDISTFRSCYDPEELLCTFKDGVENRFKDAYYFFLAKDNAFSLRREDFKNPQRDDEYSKSLICLQIDRVNHNIKMCSRYNHTVDFADSMYSNNLDNIVPGLRYAMQRDFNIKISQRECVDFAEMHKLNYVEFGPYRTMYKYNEHLNNKYYCPNNVVLDEDKAVVVDKATTTLLDYYVLDYKNHEMYSYDDTLKDCYHHKKFKKCDLLSDEKYDTYKITFEDDNELYLMSDKMHRIVAVTDNDSGDVGDNYFGFCHHIVEVNMNKVHTAGDNFVGSSSALRNINAPYFEQVGDDFAAYSSRVKYINFDYLKSCGDSFFQCNIAATEVVLPDLIHMGGFAFAQNTIINRVVLPNAEYLGPECFGWCTGVQELYTPKLIDTGGDCFFSDYRSNEYVESIVMQNMDRGEDHEMDMEEVQSTRRSR